MHYRHSITLYELAVIPKHRIIAREHTRPSDRSPYRPSPPSPEPRILTRPMPTTRITAEHDQLLFAKH